MTAANGSVGQTVQIVDISNPFLGLKLNADGSLFGASGTYTDRSGTVTAGTVSQTLMAANPIRKSILIVNPTTATENLFINFTAAASTTAVGSIPIPPGGSYSPGFVTTEQINITATTTAHAFIAKEG